MSLHPPFAFREEPEPEEKGQADNVTRKLTSEEIQTLREFFALLDEWDRKRKIS